jgi:hypothetical protein
MFIISSNKNRISLNNKMINKNYTIRISTTILEIRWATIRLLGTLIKVLLKMRYYNSKPPNTRCSMNIIMVTNRYLIYQMNLMGSRCNSLRTKQSMLKIKFNNTLNIIIKLYRNIKTIINKSMRNLLLRPKCNSICNHLNSKTLNNNIFMIK